MTIRKAVILLLSCGTLLTTAGCDQIKSYFDPSVQAAQAEADGKAIGAACRQAGRALEDCYTLNPDASKGAIFGGWKEMNDYMTEHNIATVKPELPHPNSKPVAPLPPAEGSEAQVGGKHEGDGGNESAAKEEETPPARTSRFRSQH